MAGFRDFLRMAMGWWSVPPAAVEVSYAVSARLESVARRLGTESDGFACGTESLSRSLFTESHAGETCTESIARRAATETT